MSRKLWIGEVVNWSDRPLEGFEYRDTAEQAVADIHERLANLTPNERKHLRKAWASEWDADDDGASSTGKVVDIDLTEYVPS